MAEAIGNGWADAGVCLRLVSEEAGLPFFTVREEQYDLCFSATLAHDPRIQALQQAVQSVGYRQLLGDLPGYDVDGPAGANYNGLIDPDATDPISGTVALRSYLCEVRRGEP